MFKVIYLPTAEIVEITEARPEYLLEVIEVPDEV